MDTTEQWHLIHVYDKDGKKIINRFSSLTEEEVIEIKTDKKIVDDFFSSQNVMKSVIKNRDDVIEAIFMMGKSYLDTPHFSEEIMDHSSFDISRRLANTCSLFRSFLDHFDRKFLLQYGKESELYCRWKSILSAEYDGYISYRIVYHMRNYIQHHDMPPLSLHITDKIEEDGVVVEVDIDLETLMRDENFRKKVTVNFDTGKNRISVMKVMEEWSDCVYRIFDHANSLRTQSAFSHAKNLVDLRNKFGIGKQGRIALSKISDQKITNSSFSISSNWIPEDKAKAITVNENID